MKKVLIVAAVIVVCAGIGTAQEQQKRTKTVDKASPELMKEQGGKQPTPPRAGIAVSDEGSPAEPGSKPIKKHIKK